MESYEIDIIKMEKEKAMRRYRTFEKIGNVVRTVEIFVAIMLISFSISWTSSYVPSVFKFCGVFFRRVSSVFFSPHFVFLIGNVIIITLFASFSSSEKSGQDDSPEHADVSVKTEAENDDVNTAPVTVVTAAEKEDEEVVEAVVDEEERDLVEKVYMRTQSTPARMEVAELAEIDREPVNSEVSTRAEAAEVRRRMFEEDELSNEDFRRKVEQFIERQQRFLREESKTVVLSSNNNHFTASKYSRSRSM